MLHRQAAARPRTHPSPHTPDHPGTPRLFADSFATPDGRAADGRAAERPHLTQRDRLVVLEFERLVGLCAVVVAVERYV